MNPPGYVEGDPTVRRIEGIAEVDRRFGGFVATVSDGGDSGNDDRFSIRLWNGYEAEGPLQAGNIRLHAP